MVKNGLIEEVKSILDKGYDKSLVSMQGIGYKEIIMYLENQLTLKESIELIQQKSRNYAKRQLTWFRRDDRIKWMDLDDYSNREILCDDIIEYINERFEK